jgi:hypothetical protein
MHKKSSLNRKIAREYTTNQLIRRLSSVDELFEEPAITKAALKIEWLVAVAANNSALYRNLSIQLRKWRKS